MGGRRQPRRRAALGGLPLPLLPLLLLLAAAAGAGGARPAAAAGRGRKDLPAEVEVEAGAAGPGPAGANRVKAFYILFAPDIDDPGFGAKYAAYRGGAFIVNPQNGTRAHTDKVRREVPGSTVLLYFDFNHAPLKSAGGCATGHPMGDRPNRDCSIYPCGDGNYTLGLQALWKEEWRLRKINKHVLKKDTFEAICTYPGPWGYVWQRDSADAVAAYLAGVVKDAGFDGIYLDGRVNGHIYSHILAMFPKDAAIDADGDGKADTVDEIQAQYDAWAQYATFALRRELGDDADAYVIISNSAGPLSDPMLNGISVEAESCKDHAQCLTALKAQEAVAYAGNPLSVLWLTHSEAIPADEQCELVAEVQAALPWVQAGTDFFDGSHVVCPDRR